MGPREKAARTRTASERARGLFATGLVCLSAVAALLTSTSPAAAQSCAPELTELRGIDVSRCTDGAQQYVRVVVELDAPEVDVALNSPVTQGEEPADRFERDAKAILALPGGPFRLSTAGSDARYQPSGFTVGEGEAWDVRDPSGLAVIGFDAGSIPLYVGREFAANFEPWMRTAVSGVEVLRDGALRAGCVDRGCEPGPRTGLGVSESGRELLIVSASGWTEASPGVTDEELGAILLALGARSAVRVAAGSSSRLSSRAGELVLSTEVNPRPSPALFVVTQGASAPIGSMNARITTSAGEPLPEGTAVRVQTPSGNEVATSEVDARGIVMFSLPQREYRLSASDRTEGGCMSCTPGPGEGNWCSFSLLPGAPDCSLTPFVVQRGVVPFPLAQESDAGAPAADAGGGLFSPPSEGCAIANDFSSRQVGVVFGALAAFFWARGRRRRSRL